MAYHVIIVSVKLVTMYEPVGRLDMYFHITGPQGIVQIQFRANKIGTLVRVEGTWRKDIYFFVIYSEKRWREQTLSPDKRYEHFVNHSIKIIR